jgi:hypothetical protein
MIEKRARAKTTDLSKRSSSDNEEDQCRMVFRLCVQSLPLVLNSFHTSYLTL